MRAAILLSLGCFESFYGKEFGLSHEKYLRSYRNDWSWEYVAGLNSQGVETLLYIPSVKTSGLFSTPDGYQVRFLAVKSWYRPWIRFSWLHRTPFGRYMGQLANGAAFFGDLRQSLLQDGIDLLYIQGYWTGRYDYLTKRLQFPIIAADHGTNSYRQLTWAKRRSLSAARTVTCQTYEELSEVRTYGAHAVLLPNGVDTNFFYPAPNGFEDAGADRKTILCVSRLKNRPKRITDLVRAMQFLDSQWTLQLVGDGPDRRMLEQLARDLRVEDRVRFSGFVDDRKMMREFYRKCSVFALCTSFEAVSLSVLEAMSCGCPVVVTDIRAFEALVEHCANGIKVPVGKPEELAIGIRNAYDMRLDLGKAARKTVLDNSSDAAVYTRLASIMRECQGAKSSASS